jgi:2OG-Fe dioxygenase
MAGTIVRAAIVASYRISSWVFARFRTAHTGNPPTTTRCTAASNVGSSRSTRPCERSQHGLRCSRRLAAYSQYSAHQFRIDTAAGIGRPTPEGAHRDGVDCVAVILIDRRNVRGGETRVFQAHGSAGVRFTMTEPWTALLLDDETVIHETTPIQPEGDDGVRDTLVLTYRAAGFQSPPGGS